VFSPVALFIVLVKKRICCKNIWGAAPLPKPPRFLGTPTPACNTACNTVRVVVFYPARGRCALFRIPITRNNPLLSVASVLSVGCSSNPSPYGNELPRIIVMRSLLLHIVLAHIVGTASRMAAAVRVLVSPARAREGRYTPSSCVRWAIRRIPT
jgi:hypothetical protein